MNNIPFVGMSIEDYYGTELECIYFEQILNLEPELFNLRVNSFCHSGNEDEEEGKIIRIQYEHEESTGDFVEIDSIHEQIMELLLESCDGNLECQPDISYNLNKVLELIV